MEKIDFERFGLGPCRAELKPYIVCVDGIDFRVFSYELCQFIEICLGSGFDVQMKSAVNDFLNR